MTTGFLLFSLSSCASTGPGLTWTPAPTVEVNAVAETMAVASTNMDAADDPAIWALPAGTSAMFAGQQIGGFIAGTDKKAGLYIYDFQGRELQFLPDGLLNNVDVRSGVAIDGINQVVLGASDRGRMGIALYRFDPAAMDPANAIRPWGFVKSDIIEPYGFCFGKIGAELHAIVVGKDGQVRQYRIDATGGTPVGVEMRRFAVGSQSEGCVNDDEAMALYIGEEARGVWRYGSRPEAGDERRLIQGVDSSGRLIADVEGTALIRDGDATYLIVSSQGDSAFAVWRVDSAEPVYVGRFRVAGSNGIDPVTGTDGIDAIGGPIGGFADGLVVVQDDENEQLSQNFKLVDWREIRQALQLNAEPTP